MAEKHVLLVEDDMISAKLTKHRLEKAGYTVRVVGDAYTGTQEAMKEHYDLLILDLFRSWKGFDPCLRSQMSP